MEDFTSQKHGEKIGVVCQLRTLDLGLLQIGLFRVRQFVNFGCQLLELGLNERRRFIGRMRLTVQVGLRKFDIHWCCHGDDGEKRVAVCLCNADDDKILFLDTIYVVVLLFCEGSERDEKICSTGSGTQQAEQQQGEHQ